MMECYIIRKSIMKIRPTIALQFIILRILIEIIYVFGIVPNYGYSGFVLDINYTRYSLSWVIFIVLIPDASLRISKVSFSDTVYIILFVMSYIPTCVMMGYMPTEPLFIFLFFLYWMFFSMFLNSRNKTNVRIKKQNIKFKWKQGGIYYVDKEITE